MELSHTFLKWKQQCLHKADLSKKGSVDADIAHIVQSLNDHDHFFTTSSCSGRIILLDTQIVALRKASGDAVLKFEAFVLHVQCQLLEDAQLLHTVAVNSGFRNSGITVGKKGKIVMAVRSTHSLEVPLSRKGELMVSEDYIDYVVQIANHKMAENKHRIDRFYSCLQTALSTDSAVPCTGSEPEKTGPVYTRRRKKSREAKKCKSLSAEDSDSDAELETELILLSETH